MIDNIETSKSDRAKCKRCGKMIWKGLPRGVTEYKRSTGGWNTYYFCHKCTLQKINEDIEELKKRVVDLNKMVKDKIKEVIMWELEND